MLRNAGIVVALSCLVACITVPPEQTPSTGARLATATVDWTGRIITGGNLTLEIPEGALDEGERIEVTIDLVMGAPPRHIDDTYLVGPTGYQFNLPIKVTYTYAERDVDEVSDLDALFVGVAQGTDWLRLDGHGHDTDRREVWGEVEHFSVFGLVDPNQPADGGGIADSGRRDAGAPDVPGMDITGLDILGLDLSPQPDAAADNGITIELTWPENLADMDLHLLHDAVEDRWTDDDCYFANCGGLGTGLDWPPTGAAGNPALVDALQGPGPETITMAQPTNGTFIAAVFLYNPHSEALPFNYTVTIYHRTTELLSVTREITTRCQFVPLANITVSNGGQNVAASERSDEPFVDTSYGSCQ